MKAAALAIVAAVVCVHSHWARAAARTVPDTMMAAAIDKGGGPEVLVIHRLRVPTPKAGEVLVAVRTAGVACPMRGPVA